MAIEEKIEKVRNELHVYIDVYGTRDVRTVNKSQELDKLLNKYRM